MDKIKSTGLKLGLAILGLVIYAIPWITRNHIYQITMTASDAQAHSNVIDAFTNGTGTPILYPAQAVFGFILGSINKIFHAPPIAVFVVFSYVALVGVGFTIYYVVSRLTRTSVSGFLAVLVTILCTTSILVFFLYGTIYNLIDMYIVLPFAVFCLVKWLANKRVVYLVGGLLIVALFSSLHLVSIYIPYTVATIVAGLIVYSIVTRRNTRYFIGTALLVLAVNLVFSWLFLRNQLLPLVASVVANADTTVRETNQWAGYLYQMTWVYLTPKVLVLGLLTAITMVLYRKHLVIKAEAKYLICIVGALALVLVAGGILGVSGYPGRVMLDASTVVALSIALGMGELWQVKKVDLSWFKVSSLAVIGVSVVLTLIEWMR